MSSASAAKWQKRSSLRPTEIHLLMYLIEIEYNIAGKFGTTYYVYFRPGMSAREVIGDLLSNERISGDVDIAGLHIETSTNNDYHRTVDNVEAELGMKPGMEMSMKVFGSDACRYAERELPTTPDLLAVQL
ncbi:hypothetical protein LPJ60_001598 [Coemansia sp. RSA 2675]|nr:hypothetical protein LPJ60_001598 [Coemansia sp. RSA 2675]